SRTKQIIPYTQADAIVYPIPPWKNFGMMPDMHLGIVDQVTQWSQGKLKIGMIKVSHRRSKNMNQEKSLNPKTYHGHWDIFQGSVNHGFSRMKTQMGCKSHLLYRMVKVIESPQKIRPVKQTVYVPLNKIPEHKKC